MTRKLTFSLITMGLMASALLAQDQPRRGPHKMRQEGMEHCQAAMARVEKKKAEMEALDARLKEKVETMNTAEGEAKIEAMAVVVNELMAQRTKMHEAMISMTEQKRTHMMEHAGKQGEGMECPMMQRRSGSGETED